MIDWIGVITNSVWLSGLAVCLAALSYADWRAHTLQCRLRAIVSRPEFQLAWWTGLTLFCVGVALANGQWWEHILWGVLALMALVETWRAGRAMRARANTSNSDISHRISST